MSIRKRLKKVLPPISLTEQEALDAGDIWLEASIYQGKPDMSALRAVPQATLSKEEQAFLDGPVQELLAMTDDFELANSVHMPDEILAFIKQHRFFLDDHPEKIRWFRIQPLCQFHDRRHFGSQKWRPCCDRYGAKFIRPR